MQDQFYKSFEEIFRGSPEDVKRKLEVYLPFAKEIASYTSSKLIIDLGCGRGEWLGLAQQESVTAKGVDIDDSMLNSAIKSGLDVENCDAITFLKAQEAESIGLITAFHLVEHLPFPELLELIDNSYRCLAPGGIIILETPNPENLSVAALGFHLDPTHIKPLPPALLAFAVAQCGFERTSILRLNENAELGNKPSLALADVLTGASPDYSVIAQKPGSLPSPEIDRLFSEERGITLEALAHNYDGNLRNLRAEQEQLKNRITGILKENEHIVNESKDLGLNIGNLEKKIEELSLNIADLGTKNEDISFNLENLEKKNNEINSNIEILNMKLGELAAGVKEQGEWVVDFSGRHAVALEVLEKRILKLERGLLGLLVSYIGTKFTELYWTITRALGLAHLHDGSGSLPNDEVDLRCENATHYSRLPLATESVSINLAYLRLDAARRYLANNPIQNSSAYSRPRLAFVSPLPPQRTGVADYSNELLPVLGEQYEVVAIVENQAEVVASIKNVTAIMDVEWFKERALEFDRIVYQFGNSENHAYMLPLLRIFPGVVVMHDFFLGHFIGAIDKYPPYCGVWSEELYRSEGYSALIKKFSQGGDERVIDECPVNFTLIQEAVGVVFHSQYSFDFAQTFYGRKVSSHCRVVRHGRASAPLPSRAEARAYLGIEDSAFVVCSFGFIGPNKLSQKIFDAWKIFAQSGLKPAELFFVGGSPPSAYCQNLCDDITSNYLAGAKITGYVSQHVYRQYLAACDVAVQLRSNTRGETSGATLDCMGAGIPTIVSNHGPFVEIPDPCVIKVAEDCSVAQLAQLLANIFNQPQSVEIIGLAAKEYVKRELSFSLIASQYFQAIEEFYRTGPKISKPSEIMAAAKSILDELPEDDEPLRKAAAALSSGFDLCCSNRQLFIDISALIKEDLNSGVQRVVKAQLIGLLRNPPDGFRVEPIYLSDQSDEKHFRYANKFTAKLLGFDGVYLDDRAISYGAGDIYYMPDLCYWSVQSAKEGGLYHAMRSTGVQFIFLVYDNLPVTLPECFPEGASAAHEAWLRTVVSYADQLICISGAVRDDVESWFHMNEPERLRMVRRDVLHLGADFKSRAKSSEAVDARRMKLLAKMKKSVTFLMVGTIEPRKGHLQALDAFDEFWAQENDINFVIVGAEGWRSLPEDQRRSIPEVIRRIRMHPKIERNLFWINDADDEYLELIYQSSSCLLVASENEGFGLPLIEAAYYKLPVVARDIPIFRELLGDQGVYFTGKRGSDLVKCINEWLKNYRNGNRRPFTDNVFLTWEQHVAGLKKLLNQDRPWQ